MAFLGGDISAMRRRTYAPLIAKKIKTAHFCQTGVKLPLDSGRSPSDLVAAAAHLGKMRCDFGHAMT